MPTMKEAGFSTRFAAATILFVVVEVALVVYVDKPLALWLRDLDARDPGLIDVFRAYTDIGKSKWYLWPSGLGAIACFSLLRRRGLSARLRGTLREAGQALAFLFVTVAVSGLVADLIKPLVGRARPVVLERQDIYAFHPWSWFQPQWHSLPSGHSTTAFALAFVVITLAPRWRALALAFAVAVAASRVMTNEHFLSDVMAGAVVGTLTVLVMRGSFYRHGWLFERPSASQPAPVVGR